ncbi:hypothetical protein KUTeg_019433 [Tegillarca granosa]|uniref:Uncharacterized protein n=1 Tax=Tegillarca granosa TaxID=220873 RepID=A0ABQ9ECK0_TEGGR|nr:hypothetical protein KUTeg_019433 [Tegillarca granosa]
MHLKKSMLTYATLWTLADFNEQKFFSKRKHYDIFKTLRNTTVGTFVIAPMVYNWQNFAEKLYPGTTMRAVIKKTVTSNIVFGPVATSCFFVATNILERRGDIVDEWKEKFPKTFMNVHPVKSLFSPMFKVTEEEEEKTLP